MSEATKLWTVEVRGEWVTMIEPGGVIWLEFHVGDNSITEDKVRKLVRAMNMHDGLVAVSQRALQVANTLILNLSRSEDEHYEQLKFVNIESCNRLRGLVPELESALAGEAPTEPIAEPVELVVGDEYEIIQNDGFENLPGQWCPARCERLPVPGKHGAYFAYINTQGYERKGTRVEGEYRYPVAKAAEVAG